MYTKHAFSLFTLILLATQASYAGKHNKIIKKSYELKEGMKIIAGGEIYQQIGIRSQSSDFIPGITPNNQKIGMNTNATIHGSVSYKSSTNWVYGLQAGIKTNVIASDSAGSNSLDRTYVYIENKNYGRVEVGNNQSATNEMKISAGSIATGSGVIDGSWQNYASINLYSSAALTTKTLDGSNFITSPNLIIQEGDFDNLSHEKYRKITLYSPVFKGFKLGFSYAPDVANRGVSRAVPFDGDPETISERAKDALAASVTWEHKIDNNSEIQLNISGETADRNPKPSEAGTKFHKLYAAMVGGIYKNGNLSLAASYANHFKSSFRDLPNVDNSYAYTIGAAYKLGRANVTLGSLISRKNTNEFYSIGAGAEFNLAPGVLPYGEFVYFNAKQKRVFDDANSAYIASDTKNSGTAFILGTKITF